MGGRRVSIHEVVASMSRAGGKQVLSTAFPDRSTAEGCEEGKQVSRHHVSSGKDNSDITNGYNKDNSIRKNKPSGRGGSGDGGTIARMRNL